MLFLKRKKYSTGMLNNLAQVRASWVARLNYNLSLSGLNSCIVHHTKMSKWVIADTLKGELTPGRSTETISGPRRQPQGTLAFMDCVLPSRLREYGQRHTRTRWVRCQERKGSCAVEGGDNGIRSTERRSETGTKGSLLDSATGGRWCL